jgi:small ligand-binding sensory domain FIST
MIQAGVGISSDENAARAALEAAQQVIAALDGNNPDWCVAFVTSEYRESLPTLLESISGATGTPYVVGSSASGVLAADRELEHGPALGVLGVRSDQLRATPFLFHDEGDQGMTASVRLGQRLVNSRHSDDLLLVWPDPFHVRPDRLLQGLDAVLGSVPVVGGAASSTDAQGSTFQFCGTELADASVSGVRLGGKFRHVIGVTQGCHPLGEPLRVTRAHENMILELDGRSAFQLLRERAPSGLMQDLGRAVDFLFVGLLPDPQDRELRPGEYLVRNIVTADPDTGVLAISAGVEEGQSIVFAQREATSARGDMLRMLEEVSPQRTGLDYKFGFYFNCLARGRSLYDSEGVDISMLGDTFPGVPLLGFFCNAEIAPLRGINQLFTYTGILLLIAD